MKPASASRVLWLSTAAFTLLFAVWLMLGVLAVPIKAEFALTKPQFAWLAAIAVLSGSLLRLPLGMLTDRVGGRKMMTAILLLTSLPCFLLSRAHSYGALMLYALLFGVAGNAFSIGIAWNAAWFSREKQGFALGTFGAGNVGASVTKLIGPTLIAIVPAAGIGFVPGGWRFVPVMYTVALWIMAALVWFTSPKQDQTPGAGRSLSAMVQPLKQTRVWRFGLYYVVVFGAYVALSLWLPNYYTTVYSLKLSHAALLTALFIFPASLLRPLGGWLSDRFGARPVTYGVFIAMALVCLPMSLPRSIVNVGPAAFALLTIALGVGMGIGKASVYKYIPEYFPRDVGAVGGLVGTLGALGGFVLPLAFGYLDQLTHAPQSCFVVMLALVLVSFAWLHIVVRGLRSPEAALVLPGDRLPQHLNAVGR
ncbi:MAG: nitrate/nitrite transporter [Deltaproteobacteria bacterium]|nr:nitrate/nitrite transporter [Deltaproteobacteria bacterium]